MGQHDSRIRHLLIHGAALRPPLHSRSAKPVLHRPLKLERVESGAIDQHTCHVRVLVLGNRRRAYTDVDSQIH